MFTCTSCHQGFPKWSGKCSNCGAWNTLIESIHETKKHAKISGGKAQDVHKIDFSSQSEQKKIESMSVELDAVLDGGLAPGSLILLSGEPGIGKSTLALQMGQWYGEKGKDVLYVSGEESRGQISNRAKRLNVSSQNISILTESDFDSIIATIENSTSEVIIIDSISVISSSSIEGSPGSISQIRIMTEVCMNLAKKTGKSILLIGHVTKDGSISGPKTLEHLVDVVLYLEGVRTENFRILRSLKNRFGTTDNVGLFRMLGDGLKDLSNPGMEFVDASTRQLPGSALTITMEGTRPILIEIEGLTMYTKFGYPKKSSRGIHQGKLDILIAVMSRFTDIKLENSDVYINVSRGLSINDPGVDLACIAALISSKKNISLGKTIFLGEVSLTGIVKNIAFLEKRLREAQKLGFTDVYIPKNYEGAIPKGLNYKKIQSVKELEF